MIFVIVLLFLSALLVNNTTHEQPQYPNDNPDRSLDTLAYVSQNNQLILYDPRDRTEVMLLDNIRDFLLSRDGQVAFIPRSEDETDLYVFDPSTPALAPRNITQTPHAQEFPLAWSPDGRYLAIQSYQEGSGQSLFVWDGEAALNIMPDDALAAFGVDWSDDGWLAFTVLHRGANPDESDQEIYLWDGTSTVNVSQNPQGWDSAGRWSRDGQLMFGSQREYGGGVYVWDGTSLKDGAPDVDSFYRLPDELELSFAKWIDDGSVAVATHTASGTNEILVWDLESEAIIRRLSVSSENADSSLTSDGLMILSSHLASGVPSVYLDVEDTNGNILLSIHTGSYSWSPSGYLAYCGIEDGMSRVLTLWNGEESWVVAQVSYRPVQWQHVGVTFSCNNG